MDPTTLAQVAQEMVGRGGVRVLDYETPPPPPTVADVARESVAWCHDRATGLTFSLGAAMMVAGGAAASPGASGMLLAASVVLTTAATVRWAYARPARW